MKFKNLTFIVVMFFALYFNSTSDDIFRVRPIGGENFYPEDTCKISWVYKDTTDSINIYLWDGGQGQWSEIETNILSTQSEYSWLISDTLSGDIFRIKVQSASNPMNYCYSISYFSIIEEVPPIILHVQKKEEDITNKILSVYPNPAFNNLNIELFDKKINELKIWNIRGGLIVSYVRVNNNFISIPLNSLNSGEYLIDCLSETNKRYIRKIIIVR